jgi:putative ABC transport system permease protein
MFKNYLKIALRNLGKYRIYSLINIVGLSIGIACCLLILMHITDELSYDKYHKNAERIYRVTYELDNHGKTTYTAQTPAPLGPALLKEYPEIKDCVRFFRSDVLLNRGEKRFFEALHFADESIFDIFTFPFLKGNADTALEEPNSIVLTEESAEKYFGDDDPINKILTVNSNRDFIVTGVLKKIPRNSHFRFDFLVPIEAYFQIDPGRREDWGYIYYYNYLLVREGFSPGDFEKKLPPFVMKYIGGNFRDLFGENIDQVPSLYKFHLQPLLRIHLHSNLEDEMEPNGNITYVYIFSTIALFILFIACINFMNLSTGRASSRAKEVGIRKVVGARRAELIKQFLGESFLLSFISLLLAVVLVELFLPVFNSLSGKELSVSFFGNGTFLVAFLGIFIAVGILSGSYPAFLLSAFIPVDVLKGRVTAKVSTALVKKGLVVFQFAISIILVVGTVIIHNQMFFVQNKNLGFDKEHLVVVRDQNRRVVLRYESFKNELLKNPNIIATSGSSGLPVNIFSKQTARPMGAGFDEAILMPVIAVNYDFIDTYGLELVSGRKFSKEFKTDSREALIINEATAEKFGWEDPIGQRMDIIGGRKGRIIGVLKNFHISSLHEMIEPLVLYIQSYFCQYYSIRIRSEDIPHTLGFIEKTWRDFAPARPFEYSFLEDDLDQLYRAEMRLGKIFFYFTILAIFIACLGLFGLSSFTAEQRTKEIGIRKVLGASIGNIIFMLSKEFTKWVLVANIIAWPVAYYVMSRWLQIFAYRTSISVWIFILSAALALFIAFFTISFQVVKSAVVNPAESLKYE